MNRNGFQNADWIFFALLLAYSVYFLWGAATVPFHPDESTQLFMSRDFDRWLQPLSMAWEPGRETDTVLRYRELDAPLARYLIGIGRSLAGQAPLPVDWNWSWTWEENRQAGAVPDQGLLVAGRVAIAALFPFTLLFIYLTGKQLSGWPVGLLATALLASNALGLLHARRAMAEGPLIFGVAFFIWASVTQRNRPWWIAIAALISICAKQSAFALVLVGWLAVLWVPKIADLRLGTVLKRSFIYISIILVGYFCLNPLLWKYPFQAARSSWQARQTLLAQQVTDLGWAGPDRVLNTFGSRLAMSLVQVYIAPPAFEEYSNYSAALLPERITYQSIPGHDLFRCIGWGGIVLFITILGFAFAGLKFKQMEARKRVDNLFFFGSFIVQYAAILLWIPLPYQRYYVLLLPWVVLFTAIGISGLVEMLGNLRRKEINNPIQT